MIYLNQQTDKTLATYLFSNQMCHLYVLTQVNQSVKTRVQWINLAFLLAGEKKADSVKFWEKKRKKCHQSDSKDFFFYSPNPDFLDDGNVDGSTKKRKTFFTSTIIIIYWQKKMMMIGHCLLYFVLFSFLLAKTILGLDRLRGGEKANHFLSIDLSHPHIWHIDQLCFYI